MELSSILTEEELSGISPEVVAKIESAYTGELAAVMEDSKDKQRKQVDKMLEAVSGKAETMIAEAVAENVSKMKTDAINDKMYKALSAMSAVLESVGITISLNGTTSEETKKLRDLLAQANQKLKTAYSERENLKDKLNEAEKKSYIMRLVQGMKPNVVQTVLDHFSKYDVRDITSDSIMKFIDGTSNDVFMLDVDPEHDGKLNMDNVANALKDIDAELDRESKLESIDGLFEGDVEEEPKAAPKLEALSKGLKPQRASLASNMDTLFEDANVDYSDIQTDDASDIEAAMSNVQAFENLGLGKFA
jgi:glycine cleavage system regulatory protein